MRKKKLIFQNLKDNLRIVIELAKYLNRVIVK